MNLIIFATIIAGTSAALLPERNYIPQSQGSQGSQVQYFENSQSSHGQGGGGSGFTGNTRSQQDAEKNAAIVKQDLAISDDESYHFGYETSNGIRAEEAGNTVQAQGGFAYKGDDGHTYTITYTAGEEGFRPQGEHLPVAPPTPEAILEALQQNAKDEAAGIFDDGKYNPSAHGPQSGQSSSSSGQFGSSSHQGSFNQKSGYSY